MRKILLTFIVSAFALAAFAQLQKGSIYPNITFGKRIIKFDTYSIRPSISLAVSERSALGIYYDYTRYQHMPSSFYPASYSYTQSVGINYTYFRFFKNSKKWGWTAAADASYGKYDYFEKNTSGDYQHTRRLDIWELKFVPGAFYKVSNRVMLQGNLGGVSFINSNGWPFVRLEFASQLNLGLRVRLGKK